MNIATVIINLFALVGLAFAFVKDKRKAQQSLLVAIKSLVRIIPMVLVIIIFIGLLLGFVPPEMISKIIGTHSGFTGVIVVALLGAILHIPALISFPLAASLIRSGASVTAVAAFITTLTMIGMVTLPLEIKELGKTMALLRNGISFIIALVIAIIMGLIL